MGEYNLQLQGDIWTEYKEMRSHFYEKFQKFMDRESSGGRSTGISLRMKSYFNKLARFDLTDYSFHDSEETSERGEWRLRLSITCNFDRTIRQRLPKITTPLANVEITDNMEGDGNL